MSSKRRKAEHAEAMCRALDNWAKRHADTTHAVYLSFRDWRWLKRWSPGFPLHISDCEPSRALFRGLTVRWCPFTADRGRFVYITTHEGKLT